MIDRDGWDVAILFSSIDMFIFLLQCVFPTSYHLPTLSLKLLSEAFSFFLLLHSECLPWYDVIHSLFSFSFLHAFPSRYQMADSFYGTID